ncbi:MAG: DUF2442 domain-containing protein [Tepidisphaeraceae bacterium]|jgi:hypothetical protein
MSDLEVEQAELLATYVVVSEESLTVSLSDGRTLVLPLAWYPRLKHGTPAERNNWRLIGDGDGIYWPDLDEDLSVEGFLAGRKSMESPSSLKKWLADRSATDRKKRRKTA